MFELYCTLFSDTTHLSSCVVTFFSCRELLSIEFETWRDEMQVLLTDIWTEFSLDFFRNPKNWMCRFYLNYVRYAFSDNNITSGQCFVWRLTTFVLSVIINSSTSDANQATILNPQILSLTAFKFEPHDPKS